MTWLQSFFDTPARQALGWTVLGILGVVMAAGGVWFLTGDDGGSPAEAEGNASPTATATVTSTRTPSPSPSPSPSATPSLTASPEPSPAPTTGVRITVGGGGGSGSAGDSAPPAPTATPTTPPVVAGGDYCPAESSSSPPNSVIGVFTVAGSPAPAGAAVSLAFDGVVGPTRLTTAAGGYRVDYFAGPSTCANRVGAAISVVYEGTFYATGHTVGDSPGGPVVFTLAAP